MKNTRNISVLMVLLLSPLALTSLVSADSLEVLQDEPAPQSVSDSSEAYIRYLRQLEPTAAGDNSYAEANDEEKKLNESVKAFDKANAGQEQTERQLQPYDFIE